jgi:hypothetical protein
MTQSSDVNDPNQPNEYGFAGEGTVPEPAAAHPDATSDGKDHSAEDIAVPSGDLTGALSDGLDDAAH